MTQRREVKGITEEKYKALHKALRKEEHAHMLKKTG